MRSPSRRDRISVVIATTSRPGRLRDCLDAVDRQTQPPHDIVLVAPVRVVVDGLRTTLTMLPTDRQMLYAEAQNLGLRHSSGEYVLCLNDDVLLAPTYLEEVRRLFDVSPLVGMATGKILRPGSTHLDSTGQFVGRTRKAVERGYRRRDRGQYNKASYVFGPGGAAPVFRRTMLDELALRPGEYFDESFGMYYEDLDLAWRAQLAGWKAMYTPRATAVHDRGLSSSIRHHGLWERYYLPQLPEHLLRLAVINRYRLIHRYDSPRALLAHAPQLVSYEICLWTYLVCRSPKHAIDCVREIYRLARTPSRGDRPIVRGGHTTHSIQFSECAHKP